jgi:hypothetical protein
LCKYTVCKPKDGDALVKSGYEEIYAMSEESLYATVDTYLMNTTWVSRMSWKNDTDATQTFTYTYTTRLTITRGKEVNNGFSLGSVYDGLSVMIDSQETVFRQAEIAETKPITITVSVPPRSVLILYQRRYKFRNSMFFTLNVDAKHHNVGNLDNSDWLKKECEVEIMSDDYATLESELDRYLDGTKTGTLNVDTVVRVHAADATKSIQECTIRCQEKLREMLV